MEAKDPSRWRLQAYKLRLSSDVLWQEVENAHYFPCPGNKKPEPEHPERTFMDDPSYLLLGFSIECLMKGIIIAKSTDQLGSIMTHDLIILADKAK